MVLTLARALDTPLREHNVFLEAAGFARLYRESELSAPELRQAHRTLEFIIRQQEPNMTLVMNRHWDVLMSNDAGRRLMSLFIADPTEVCPDGPINALRLTFHPRGLRRWIVNWEEVAGSLLLRLHREVSASGEDDYTRRLVEELIGYGGVPARYHTPDFTEPAAPFIPLVLRHAGITLEFFTTVTTLGTAQDITLQELRIESYLPADQATEAFVRQLANQQS